MEKKHKYNIKLITIILLVLMAFVVLWVWMTLDNQIRLGDKIESFESKEDRPLVGVILKALDSDHWRMIKKGAEDAALEYGMDIVVLAPDRENNVSMQFQMIKDLMDLDIDILCVAPSDSLEIIPLLQDVNAKGIDIYTIDTNVKDMTSIISFIGTNNYEAGYIAGKRMQLKLDDTSKVLIVTGVLSQQTHLSRVQGFVVALKDSKVEIVEIVEADSDSTLAYEKMVKLLEQYSDIDGVFITSALMTLGVIEAVKPDEGFEDLVIIGFDIQKELLFDLEQGYVDSIMSQSPYDIGYKAVENAYSHLNGEKVSKNIETESILITKDNLDEYKYLFNPDLPVYNLPAE